MPKSLLDIDIHDEKFKKFLDQLKDFKGDAEKLNSIWTQFSVETKKPRAAIDALDQAVGRAHRSSEKLAKTWATLGGHIESSDKRLSKFERGIKTVERGLARVARLGMSIGKFALAAGGIGAFGGLFGIDALANSAMNQQKTARGLGMPIGQVQAFKTHMQHYLSNPMGTLQAIVNARRTPEGQAALDTFGFNPEQYNNPDVNKMKFAMELLRRVKKTFIKEREENPYAPLWTIMTSLRANKFDLSIGDMRNFAASHPGALGALLPKMETAARQDQISNKTATAWAKLKIQLDQAGIAIRNDLIKHLVKLAPVIAEASKKVEGFIREFINSKTLGRWVNDFATGIKYGTHELSEFVKFLQSKEFAADMREFRGGLKVLGDSALITARALLKIVEVLRSPAIKTVEYVAGKSIEFNSYLNKEYANLLKDVFGKKSYTEHEDKIREAVGLPPLGYYTNAANWRKHNNPGNIDPVIDGTTYYRSFPSMAAGYRGIAKLLRGYGKDTIGGLVTEYEGAGAKHLRTHIADISRWMKEAPDAKLNLSNQNTMAELVTGIARTEERHRMDNRHLYQTVREAIIDGMRTAASGGVRPTAQVANAMHAGRY